MKIAVSGKGGVGKTTVSANLARMFKSKGFNVYAVDADPDSSLGLALGIPEDALKKIKPIIEMDYLIDIRSGDGAMYTLNPDVNGIAEEFSIDAGGIRFLRMGGIKKAGSTCYCKENNFLKALVASLLLDSNDVVILDMGAGIEHLTRGTAHSVDLMLIVTEAGRASVETALLVERLAGEIGIDKVKFIANKIRSPREEEFIKSHISENKLLGMLPYDEEISERGMGLKEYSQDVENTSLQEVLGRILSL